MTRRDVLVLTRSWAAYAALPALNVITAPILARALGPVGRGQLVGILQPMVLASAIAALGVPSAVTFFVGQGVSLRRVSALAFRVAIAATLIVGAGLLLYSGAIAQQIGLDQKAILLVWLAFLPSAFIAIRRGALQGTLNYMLIDLERILAPILRVTLVVLLWLAGSVSVELYCAAYMIAGLTASAILYLPAQTDTFSGAAASQALRGIELVNYAVLASFGSIAAAMNSRLDQAIMPAIVPPVELGYYSVAVAVAEVPLFITLVSARNILAETSAQKSLRTILRSMLLGSAAQGALIGIVLVAMPYIVPLIFGKAFLPALPLIQILLLGTFLANFATCISSFLAGFGRPGFASAGPAAGAFCTAILFWLFWHQMSALVASWITVGSQLVWLSVSAILVLKIMARRCANLMGGVIAVILQRRT